MTARSTGDAVRLADRLTAMRRSPDIMPLALMVSFDPDHHPELDQEPLERISYQLSNIGARRQWMLSDSTRVETLASIVRADGARGLAEASRRVAPDFATPLDTVLASALQGDPIHLNQLIDESGEEEHLLAALRVIRWFQQVEAAVPAAPSLRSGFDRDEIRARLALLETLRPVRRLTLGGCVGRENDLGALHDHIEDWAGPDFTDLFGRHPMLVSGIGGIGKSTLVARFVQDLHERADDETMAWAYLDLDRPTLSTFEADDLIDDILRQVGSQLSDYRRRTEQTRGDVQYYQKGQGLESKGIEGWRHGVEVVADLVNSQAAGRLVVVLDTYEELERASAAAMTDSAGMESVTGLTLEDEIFEMFNSLAVATQSLRLVVSGRAPAERFRMLDHPDDRRLVVRPFDQSSATKILALFYEAARAEKGDGAAAGFEEGVARDVYQLVGGSPLVLRLAARVLAREGVARFADVAQRAHTLSKVRAGLIVGFLYNRILDHLSPSDPRYRDVLPQIARVSLPLHRVDEALMREVLLPAIGREDLSVEAAGLLDSLRMETAMVEGVDGFRSSSGSGPVRVRPELRGPALRVLVLESRVTVEDIHERAIGFYEAHPDRPESADELVYHRLALGQDVGDRIELVATARDGIDPWLDGLPSDARNVVSAAVLQPRRYDEEQLLRGWEQRVASSARSAFASGEIGEAEQQLAKRAERSVSSPLHELDARVHQARGRFDLARAAYQRDIDGTVAAGRTGAFAASSLALASAEELTFDDPEAGVQVLTAAISEPLLASANPYRLELHLNRMTMLERAAMDADWWVEELDALTILQHLTPLELERHTSLTRLLAATLGRSDLSYIRQAVERIGIGPDPADQHILSLAKALAGSGAAPAGDGEGAVEFWYQELIGRGQGLETLLTDLWSTEGEQPPSAVLEALRAIYVWWGVPLDAAAGPDRAEAVEESAGDGPEQHFLDDQPDFRKTEFQSLERIIIGAYHEPGDLELLASQIGLDGSQMDLAKPVERAAREFVKAASEQPGLPALVDNILLDDNSRSFHGELRGLVGDVWLEQRSATGDQP